MFIVNSCLRLFMRLYLARHRKNQGNAGFALAAKQFDGGLVQYTIGSSNNAPAIDC